MIRFACLIQLVALATLVVLALRPEGATAILFAFVGFPLVGLGVLLYGYRRWSAGAFREVAEPASRRRLG